MENRMGIECQLMENRMGMFFYTIPIMNYTFTPLSYIYTYTLSYIYTKLIFYI